MDKRTLNWIIYLAETNYQVRIFLTCLHVGTKSCFSRVAVDILDFLGDNMNRFLNENWKEVTSEIGPAVGEAIAEVFRIILTNIADLVPWDYIYPDLQGREYKPQSSKK